MDNINESIANKFYTAFKNKDANGMISLYHTDVRFEDPAFGKLDYEQVTAMWRMLCESAKDLTISFTIESFNDCSVKTRWLADYSFSKTKRQVHNQILAEMTIKDGQIIEHLDRFNLHRWARQALGLQGILLGGTKFFQKKLQAQTNRQLKKYMKKNIRINPSPSHY